MPKRKNCVYARLKNFGEYYHKHETQPPMKKRRIDVAEPGESESRAVNEEIITTPSESEEPSTVEQNTQTQPNISTERPPRNGPPRRVYQFAPPVAQVRKAFDDITRILRPKFQKGVPGSTTLTFDKDDNVLRRRMELMQAFMWKYVNPATVNFWMRASKETASEHRHSKATAENLRKWTQSFIIDRDDLPYHNYGKWSDSMLHTGDLAGEIRNHLLGLGKYVCATDVVRFVATPEVMQKYSLTGVLSPATAKRWLNMMEYRWTSTPTGQYVDGHDREAVVAYRQSEFLPRMEALAARMQWFKQDGAPEVDVAAMHIAHRRVIVWFHDESTFYANDRREVYWVHKDEKATPRTKGEGASFMVSDFVSADFGWLRSPDGQESARVFLKAGKNRGGYFTNDDVLEQLDDAIDIVKKYYPDCDHKFVLDNARTHSKRAEDALSARKMSKGPTAAPKEGKPVPKVFGVDINVLDENRKPMYSQDGTLLKQRVPMGDGTLPDGRPQSLYWPANHPEHPAGNFKGMAEILRERGYHNARKLRSECFQFRCPPPTSEDPTARRWCCCRRILYEEPDFIQVETKVETLCKSRGVGMIFLPKFHCELNPIERCWADAKRTYRLNPPDSSESALERNVVAALESVSLLSIRRYVMSSFRYMDAYRKGLNGAQAAYAHKAYRGHRAIPNNIVAELDKLGK